MGNYYVRYEFWSSCGVTVVGGHSACGDGGMVVVANMVVFKIN